MADHSAYIDATAALLGVKVTAEQRPGLIGFFELAAQMAALVEGLPLTPADEAANVFRPVEPEVGP